MVPPGEGLGILSVGRRFAVVGVFCPILEGACLDLDLSGRVPRLGLVGERFPPRLEVYTHVCSPADRTPNKDQNISQTLKDSVPPHPPDTCSVHV